MHERETIEVVPEGELEHAVPAQHASPLTKSDEHAPSAPPDAPVATDAEANHAAEETDNAESSSAAPGGNPHQPEGAHPGEVLAEPNRDSESGDDGGGIEAPEPGEAPQVVDAADLFGDTDTGQASAETVAESTLRAVVEAVIYVTEEPLTIDQIATGLDQSKERIQEILRLIEEECARSERGVSVREVAGGYKMGTKPEHHEAIRAFVKKLRPPFKLSLAALETLAVIAYKQPITTPEIMEVRGVQGAGVIKTLLDRKLIAPAGRKQVIGKPILYKTTKEFLLQFGLKDLLELPTLKEFEDLRRLAFSDDELAANTAAVPAVAAETLAPEAEKADSEQPESESSESNDPHEA